jgi:hypothetical protein
MKNKPENLKAMLKQRVAELDKQIFGFEPRLHLTYSAFDEHIDNVEAPICIGQYAFLPSKVLMLNMDAYLEMFKHWADSVDFEQIPEYNQLKDEREQTLDWLMELEQ